MSSNWKICQNDLSSLSQCEDFQNNCDKCGKLYRYNWRRRRTREKTCNLCVSDIRCNLLIDNGKESCKETNANFKSMDDNLYVEKRIWDAPMSTFRCGERKEEPKLILGDSMKKVFGIEEFTEQLFHEMKIEFGEELRNPHKPFKTDFDWPTTDQLNKVDCLRAFNIMKQILLQEMSTCDTTMPSNPLALRKKFYLERRFQSLEKEKIRRLKVYESLYIKEEVKGGL